ncbi:GNAT family N-acetyltransferase [Oceanirhabdus sp. W0125-5]|uniref:GNAT family N-acetyltransferase n=1 Tax=Oceanirhabdus sp. W0125-5 TaxID=2999116 RepID=UPI0022F2FE30|nr:GNAT family N-acetyltransferase [Oceanirhabdus sp. W0125-5]WBW97269.1 GNAT family N-acetyltransferase [Oceanirhabdus sp. W0125-5]
MNINWLEWLGYLASLIVLISLLMSSILKLRWINLAGSCMFSLYGFLIGALPVGFMNLGIASINIYYLVKIYSTKEFFKILPTEGNSQYFNYFLDFYKTEIEKYSDKSQFNISNYDVIFYILRNMVPAGLFIGSRYNEDTLNIELDFVIPQYRDFKIGTHVFEHNKQYFMDKGYSKFISFSSKNEHIKYLKKMGFKESEENNRKCFIKSYN